MSNILIIGASHAGIAAAAKLRQLDAEIQITIICDEAELPYQRPPLSKNYITGDMPLARLHLRPVEWFDNEQIKLCRNQKAIAIVTKTKQVQLSNGDKIGYDKLLIATGAHARKLPAKIGGNLPNVRSMRNLSDANWLMDNMQTGKNLVVIGGGYIGLEAAAEAAKKGLNVTIIEAADRILKRVACAETSNAFRALHMAKGVKVLENTHIEQFTENQGIAAGVKLKTGETLPLDFAIVGIGIDANIELAQNAGLEVDSGIVVDQYCATSHDDIYAAGDCTILPFQSLPTRLESVQNAHDQAAIAAANMLGKQLEYKPYPWFWSNQYEVRLQIAGLNRDYNDVLIKQGKREGSVSHFYFCDQRLIAVDCLNDPATYAMTRKLLEANATLTKLEITANGFDLKTRVKALTSAAAN